MSERVMSGRLPILPSEVEPQTPGCRTGLYAPQVNANQARTVLQHATRTMVTTSRLCRETVREGIREQVSLLIPEALAA
jgi:hypothetical protein